MMRKADDSLKMKGIRQEEWKQSGVSEMRQVGGGSSLVMPLVWGTALEGGIGGLRLTGECLQG